MKVCSPSVSSNKSRGGPPTCLLRLLSRLGGRGLSPDSLGPNSLALDSLDLYSFGLDTLNLDSQALVVHRRLFSPLVGGETPEDLPDYPSLIGFFYT